jgi:DNA-binding SARP family transcriptional activator
MLVRVFGSLSVTAGRRVIRITAPKERVLLAALAMDAGKTAPNDELCRALWGTDWSPRRDVAFRPLIRRLRKTLGEERLIVTESLGYRLAANPGDVDLLVFEALDRAGTAAAAAGDWRQALVALTRAEGIRQRGALFGDVPSEYLRHKHVHYLETRLLLVREKRIEAAIRVLPCRAAADVLPDLELLIREHPQNEHLRWLHMLSLYRASRQGDAQQAFREAWAHGKSELGKEPGLALKELNQRIVGNDPALLREPFGAPPAT